MGPACSSGVEYLEHRMKELLKLLWREPTQILFERRPELQRTVDVVVYPRELLHAAEVGRTSKTHHAACGDLAATHTHAYLRQQLEHATADARLERCPVRSPCILGGRRPTVKHSSCAGHERRGPSLKELCQRNGW